MPPYSWIHRRKKKLPTPQEVMESPLPFLTISEVAVLLRRKATATYALAERGDLPGAVKLGGRWLIDREELLAGIKKARSMQRPPKRKGGSK